MHFSGGMIGAAYIQNRGCFAIFDMGIFNVDFLEIKIVGFEENLTVAL